MTCCDGVPNVYQIDSKITLRAAFFLADRITPADPSTVELFIMSPDGEVDTPTPTHGATGVYAYDLTLDQVGDWIYKFQGKGDVEVTSPDTYLTVVGSVFPTTP